MRGLVALGREFGAREFSRTFLARFNENSLRETAGNSVEFFARFNGLKVTEIPFSSQKTQIVPAQGIAARSMG